MLLFYLSLIDKEEDRQKFENLAHEYQQLMKHTAQDILKSEFIADEAVSEAFIKIARNMHCVEDVYSHKTCSFVVTIVKRTAIDILRVEKKQKFVSFEEEYDQNLKIPTKYNYNFEELELSFLIEQIKALPDIYRDALMLKYYHGYSDKEAADLLGISHAAVRKRVERAKQLLAYYLGKGDK